MDGEKECCKAFCSLCYAVMSQKKTKRNRRQRSIVMPGEKMQVQNGKTIVCG
jgi:hypothetical protein